jgi:hypothetical protein
VMEALEHALMTPGAFPGGIYWVARDERELLPAVRKWLRKAADTGATAVIVESQNFDELTADLVNQFVLPEVLHRHVFEARPTPVLRPVSLPSVETLKFPVLRCSALLIDRLPLTARRLTLSSPASTVTVRELLREARINAVAASIGREVAAFGPDCGLVTALAPLGARLAETIALNPGVDSWALGLLYDALTKALCRNRPLFPRLRRSGHAVLVSQGKSGESDERKQERHRRLAQLRSAYNSPLDGIVPDLGFPFNEGVRLRLENCAGRWWCVFEPFTFVEVPKAQRVLAAGEDSDESRIAGYQKGDPASDWRRERWALKYNSAWTKIIDGWAYLLASSDDGTVRAFGIPEEAGMDAVFGLSSVTAWSRPAHQHEYFRRRR